MTFTATSVHGEEVCRETYYSVGGGFVGHRSGSERVRDQIDRADDRYSFGSAAELLTSPRETGSR